MNKAPVRTVEDYLRLPYTIQLRQYEDGTFFAEVAELPGCMTEADTADDAVRMIRDAMAGWIEVALSEGIPIPEPVAETRHSGRFLVRAPKSLHRDLVQRAKAEGASLNQFVVTTLSRALGARSRGRPR
jgi:antitoxin HicB